MTSDENQTPDNEQNPAANAAEENLAAENDPALDPSAIAEQLAIDNADLKDRLLRLAADMENLRKRTEREISDARNYAIANFARDMLVATDNLSRAIVMLPQEARDSNDPSMKALIEGIEMTDREMQRLLQKNGVKPIIAEGEKFDPHKHQAMFEVPNSGAADGTVVQVVQAGFAIGDRVLRPAMVGVAKGGPKAPASDTAPEGSTIDKEA